MVQVDDDIKFSNTYNSFVLNITRFTSCFKERKKEKNQQEGKMRLSSSPALSNLLDGRKRRMKNRRELSISGGISTCVLFLLLINVYESPNTTRVLAIRRPCSNSQIHNRKSHLTKIQQTNLLRRIARGGNDGGGGNWRSGNSSPRIIEANPEYVNYKPQPSQQQRSRSCTSNEHEEWLQQQQQLFTPGSSNANSYYGAASSASSTSILGFIQNYFSNLRKLSPTLYYTTLSCIGVFFVWRLPIFTSRNPATKRVAKIVTNLLVCSQQSCIETFGLSLLTACISHISVRHLLMNLFTLLHVGPTVKREILSHQRQGTGKKTDIWPLMLGSAVVGNFLFLLANYSKGKEAACLGLSGVTMALVALLASTYPNRVFGIMVFGIFPVRLPASYILQMLLLVSVVGALVPSMGGGNIAHWTHLGGLVYGIAFYELNINKSNKRFAFLANNNNKWRSLSPSSSSSQW